MKLTPFDFFLRFKQKKEKLFYFLPFDKLSSNGSYLYIVALKSRTLIDIILCFKIQLYGRTSSYFAFTQTAYSWANIDCQCVTYIYDNNSNNNHEQQKWYTHMRSFKKWLHQNYIKRMEPTHNSGNNDFS